MTAVFSFPTNVAIANPMATSALTAAKFRTLLYITHLSRETWIAKTSAVIAKTIPRAVLSTKLFVTGEASPPFITLGLIINNFPVHDITKSAVFPMESLIAVADAFSANAVMGARVEAFLDAAVRPSVTELALANAVVAPAIFTAVVRTQSIITNGPRVTWLAFDHSRGFYHTMHDYSLIA